MLSREKDYFNSTLGELNEMTGMTLFTNYKTMIDDRIKDIVQAAFDEDLFASGFSYNKPESDLKNRPTFQAILKSLCAYELRYLN